MRLIGLVKQYYSQNFFIEAVEIKIEQYNSLIMFAILRSTWSYY